MKFSSNIVKWLAGFALFLPMTASVQAGCTTAEIEKLQTVAKAVVGALPAVNFSAARRARFEVTPDQTNGSLAVKYSNLRRTLFEQNLNLKELAPDVGQSCGLVGRRAQGRPGNGLFLRLSCEPAQSTPGCSIVIQPGVNRSGHSGWTYRISSNRVVVR